MKVILGIKFPGVLIKSMIDLRELEGRGEIVLPLKRASLNGISFRQAFDWQISGG